MTPRILFVAAVCLIAGVGARAGEVSPGDFPVALVNDIVPAADFDPGEVTFSGRVEAAGGAFRFTKIRSKRPMLDYAVLSEKIAWLDSTWPQHATKNKDHITADVVASVRLMAGKDMFWDLTYRTLMAAVYPKGKPMSTDPVLIAAFDYASDKSIAASKAYTDLGVKMQRDFGVNPVPQRPAHPAATPAPAPAR